MSNTPDSNRPDSNRPDSNRPDSNRPDQRWPDDERLQIAIVVDAHVACPIDREQLRHAVVAAAADRGYDRGEIGVRVTDDPGIHQVNRDHLGHDYPTDVISFGYHADRPDIEGELIVSVDTAAQRARELGWPLTHELTLYVIHGVLHITGMDDRHASERADMRDAEQRIMVQLGIQDIIHYGAEQAGPKIVEGPS